VKCKYKVDGEEGENCNITPSLGIVVLNDGIFFVTRFFNYNGLSANSSG
jgi:hypothetical protein